VSGRVPVTMAPATAEYVYEPFGVCLIIGPFNFPIFLIISPILGAIAAGNCVIVKPSELATRCESLFAELIPKYMDPRCIQVVTGGVETNQHLLCKLFLFMYLCMILIIELCMHMLSILFSSEMG
jgi:aldehyde dehydrogenase (NAD+)